MTTPGSATGSAQAVGRKRIWPWFLLAAGLLGIGMLGGAPNEEGQLYDPGSNGKHGTKALVELLGSFGADVDVVDRYPPRDADIAIAFPGEVPENREEALSNWVAAGHVLVVADPRSGLNPLGGEADQIVPSGDDRLVQGECTIRALREAKVIQLAEDEFSSYGSRLYPVPAGAQSCFDGGAESDGGRKYADIVSVNHGQGQIVSVASPQIFVNSLIDEADNAVVAVDLLAPSRGRRVAIMRLPAGEAGEADLSDLVSTGVKLAMLQLVVAFVVYSFVRGRRLGKPVLEPQPVQIPGSELVSAVGNLLQQTKSPDRAAAILRADARRRLAERLGLPGGASAEVLAASVAARSGIPQEESFPLLVDIPCPTEQALMDLAAALDDLRRQVLGESA